MHIIEAVPVAALQQFDVVWRGGRQVRVTEVVVMLNMAEPGVVLMGIDCDTADEVGPVWFDGTELVERSCAQTSATAHVDHAVCLLYAALDAVREGYDLREVSMLLEDAVIQLRMTSIIDQNIADQLECLAAILGALPLGALAIVLQGFAEELISAVAP